MASRIEWCRGCERQLRVSAQAVAVQCSGCQFVTRFRPLDRWTQAYGSVVQAQPRGRFYNVVDTVTNDHYLNNMDMEAANADNYGSYPVSGIYGNDIGYNYNTDYGPPQPRPRPRPRPRPMAAPAALPPPPGFHGRKRAVLCGVSYYDTNYKLSGSVNDVKRMWSLLVGKLGFPAECVVMLTEEEKNPLRVPTKRNIRLAMSWLVHDCQPGDSLLFHFSGHGSRQKDYNNDELDGFDETLSPLDHETEGQIIDDEINATIVRPLRRGAILHAIVDSCFSGTVLDLPYLCRLNSSDGSYRWEDQRCPAACYNKGTSGGLAICISACDDHQTSASTSTLSSKEVTGAMTSSFIQAVQNKPGLTYGRLLCTMHHLIPSLIQNNTGLFQEPLLSSSEIFDIYAKQVIF